LKFTKKGVVHVHMSVKDCELLITIKDSGVGIPEEKQSKLFQPFTQVDSSTARKFGGTGLGLTLSRKLARALGGEVSLIDSQLNVGSTFVFSHPCRVGSEIEAEKPADAGIRPKVYDTYNLGNLNILIVDDSA